MVFLLVVGIVGQKLQQFAMYSTIHAITVHLVGFLVSVRVCKERAYIWLTLAIQN